MDVCQILVAAKADVNASGGLYDSHPYTRSWQCVQDLGFVLNVLILVFFCSGGTLLHQSSDKGHVDLCQFLVASNADVNATDGLYDSHPYTRI